MVQMSARSGTLNEVEDSRCFSAPTRGRVEAELESLKEQLLHEFIRKISNNSLIRELTWAANEAAALAWCTVCPILVLPVLLEERVHAAIVKWEKQQRMRGEVFQPQENSALYSAALPAAA